MKNCKSISAWLMAVLVVSFIGACGGGSSPLTPRPDSVQKPTKAAEYNDAPPVKDQAQPEVKKADVKVDPPAQQADESSTAKTNADAQNEQQTADASKEQTQQPSAKESQPNVPPLNTPPVDVPPVKVNPLFTQQDPVVANAHVPFQDTIVKNVTKPHVEVVENQDPAVPARDEVQPESEKENPDVKVADTRFKLVDRAADRVFIDTNKKQLGLDDLDLQDDELYVRCELPGYKTVHMIATGEYMTALQARENVRSTARGFTWTQTHEVEQDGVKTQATFEFDCVVWQK